MHWNENLLDAIRLDAPRPVVHARNLYHHSLGMYNLFGLHVGQAGFAALSPMLDEESWAGVNLSSTGSLEWAWAAYSIRFIQLRFANSPEINQIEDLLEAEAMTLFGLGVSEFLSANEVTVLSALYAEQVTEAFLDDGSNELNGYANTCYSPSNPALELTTPLSVCGELMVDANTWQPLAFEGEAETFLGANWGAVESFALPEESATTMMRDGCSYRLHFDPGAPGLLGQNQNDELYEYQKGFAMVVDWQQHLNPNENVLWDVSPNSRGNINVYPDAPDVFYSFEDGEIGHGYAFNPTTSSPYLEEWVSRSDYTRSLAEFWADGPNSETPPGHWFALLNQVVLTPGYEPAWNGVEEMELDAWLAKAYLLLGGSMHDCAVAAWGTKGYYDFVRPISAIRNMSSLGQSSNSEGTSYHPYGMILSDGSVEVIAEGDPLLEVDPSYLGQIKIKQWVPNIGGGLETTFDWRLGCEWLPYQLPSFVTPPFAGYLSGHSTFSRAAADLLTYMTGSPYFPGGEGVFEIESGFLEFDSGPSVGFSLRWATYQDAANESGLSRIWGGIHPPMDDLRGRLLGAKVAEATILKGSELFTSVIQGCMYASALNYSEDANDDDGSCLFEELPTTCAEDLNGDGVVGMGDLLMLLAAFGNACV